MREPIQGASAIAYSPERQKFLLLERSETKKEHPGKWEFPGGISEDGEEPKTTALRELKEETGLSGKILRTGDAGITHVNGKNYMIHPFLVKLDSGEPELSEEHQEFRWVEQKEIPGFDHVEGLFSEMRAVDLISEPTEMVAAVPRGEDGKVLILKRSELMGTNAEKWEFVSGRVKDTETAEEAAHRELRQETGMEGETIRTAESFTIEADEVKFRVNPVLVEVKEGKPELSFEHDEFRWLKPEEVLELETVPGVQNDLERLNLL